MKESKVAIIGLGYVGLPTYVAIHQTGNYHVVGYTRNQKRIDALYRGLSQIDEPYVDEYLSKHQQELHFTNNEKDLEGTEIFIICVPTPVFDDFNPDYGPVISATKLIAPYIKKGAQIVLESTVNPGTSREVLLPILEERTGLKAGTGFNIAHCPERVNPGDKRWNIYNINRNIGSVNKAQNQKIAAFYRKFLPDALINEVASLEVAEATKIVENSFRDINIAFVNELAQSFDKMKIDVKETIDAAANKPFGFMAHYPGCGVGGHCIAVDPYYLIKKAATHGFDHKFLKLAREINNDMPKYTVYKLMEELNQVGYPVKGTKVALLGLSYKPDIADLRNSPSYEILSELERLGADVVIYDPFIFDQNHGLSTDVTIAASITEAVKDSIAVLIATAHSQFTNELPALLSSQKTLKVVVDGRNCLEKSAITDIGLRYSGIGL
ncbi:MAG: nucleotide sugar dehydrogenase [Patescibacteria group bacterium]